MIQLKSIAIFGYKQRILSLDMKTKVVQHVPRINLSYLKFQIFKILKIFKFQIFKNFQIFSGSQPLSDFQTFFICNLPVIYWVRRKECLTKIDPYIKTDWMRCSARQIIAWLPRFNFLLASLAQVFREIRHHLEIWHYVKWRAL